MMYQILFSPDELTELMQAVENQIGMCWHSHMSEIIKFLAKVNRYGCC